MPDPRNLVIYQVLIDRFSCGKKKDSQPVDDTVPDFCGGNLRGVRERLDHLQQLGVNAIWLSPFMRTSAYHGYMIEDFYSVEPRFGTLHDLQELCREAHRRGMLVLMDFVPNHVSKHHRHFIDAQQDPQSRYRDWFHFTEWPVKYRCFLHYGDLPKLNLDNPAARSHAIGAALHWMDQGIDGFRLDHVLGPKNSFWREFRSAVKQKNPDALLLGEAWMDGVSLRHLDTLGISRIYWHFMLSVLGRNVTPDLMRRYVGIFDGTFDFGFCRWVRENAENPAQYSEAWLKQKLKEHYASYPQDYLLPTFLDNHDMDRFLAIVNGDKEKLKAAAKLQFSIEQPAVIYYGTEAGLSQTRRFSPGEEHTDLLARRMMCWDRREWDNELLAFYKALIKDKTQRVLVNA